MESSQPALFISDLHLSPLRPEGVERFRRFIRDTASQAESLYILGDFFEAWVGDDQLADPFLAGIVSELRGLGERGVRIGFLPGNRDFLAGEGLARAAGMSLLPDPMRLSLFGVPTLLCHGDLFCTDDRAYQAFRSQVRAPAWQAAFLAKPIEARLAIAEDLRLRSETAKAGKSPEIMDVNEEAVRQAFQDYGVRRIIHGHTHRPARHGVALGDTQGERWVLPDWYEGGGYLRCDERGCFAKGLS